MATRRPAAGGPRSDRAPDQSSSPARSRPTPASSGPNRGSARPLALSSDLTSHVLPEFAPQGGESAPIGLPDAVLEPPLPTPTVEPQELPHAIPPDQEIDERTAER